MKIFTVISAISVLLAPSSSAFTVHPKSVVRVGATKISSKNIPTDRHSRALLAPQLPSDTFSTSTITSTTSLEATPDLEVVALVAGQENYGLAIVAMGEAFWSFLEAPSLSHAKIFIPATIAAIILVAVSGPMVTNVSDPAAIKLGLEIATGVSALLVASYLARLLAPFSPSAKEIAFGGLLLAVAGFFSFSQNLVVDEFVQLPSIPLPSLPTIEFPSIDFDS